VSEYVFTKIWHFPPEYARSVACGKEYVLEHFMNTDLFWGVGWGRGWDCHRNYELNSHRTILEGLNSLHFEFPISVMATDLPALVQDFWWCLTSTTNMACKTFIYVIHFLYSAIATKRLNIENTLSQNRVHIEHKSDSITDISYLISPGIFQPVTWTNRRNAKTIWW
jgi:hypothetical protein